MAAPSGTMHGYEAARLLELMAERCAALALQVGDWYKVSAGCPGVAEPVIDMGSSEWAACWDNCAPTTLALFFSPSLLCSQGFIFFGSSTALSARVEQVGGWSSRGSHALWYRSLFAATLQPHSCSASTSIPQPSHTQEAPPMNLFLPLPPHPTRTGGGQDAA